MSASFSFTGAILLAGDRIFRRVSTNFRIESLFPIAAMAAMSAEQNPISSRTGEAGGLGARATV